MARPGERMGNEEGFKESVGRGWTKKRRERTIRREEGVSKGTEAGSFKGAEETACVSMGRCGWEQSTTSGKEGGQHLKSDGSHGRYLRAFLLPARGRTLLPSESKKKRKHFEMKPRTQAVCVNS